jgi:hypothetical protein
MGSAGDAAARGRAREALIVVAGVSAVIAVIVRLLAVTVLPPVLANLSAEAVAADTTVPIAADSSTTVLVPAGWVVRRSPFDGTLRLSSPDAGLTVSLVTGDDGAGEVATDVADSSDAVTERLASGLDARHAFRDGRFVAAVGDGGTATVLVAAEASTEAELDDYITALALILDGIGLEGVPE